MSSLSAKQLGFFNVRKVGSNISKVKICQTCHKVFPHSFTWQAKRNVGRFSSSGSQSTCLGRCIQCSGRILDWKVECRDDFYDSLTRYESVIRASDESKMLY